MDFYLTKPSREEKIESDSESEEYSDIIGIDDAIKNLQENEIDEKNESLPKLHVVLDIDKTLIYPSLSSKTQYDFSIEVETGNGKETAFITKRPNLDDFLTKLSEIADVSIFTAANTNYAKQIIDVLDPEKKIFSRYFFVDSCVVPRPNIYVKDLSVVGTDLSRTVLVDDSFMSFGGKYDNAIKVTPFNGSKKDTELNAVLNIITKLVKMKDIRPFLRSLNMKSQFFSF